MAVLPDPKNLDLNVVALARAIRYNESRNKYDAKGQSGEGGAYQFMPSVWKEWAGKYIKDPNAAQTPENQNAVAYLRLKDLKDQGNSPAQILSIWNSGSPNWQGKKGTNKYGADFNVPLYVEKGIQRFQEEVTKLGGTLPTGSGLAAAAQTTTTPEAASETKPGLLKGAAQAIAKPFLRTGLGIVRAAAGIKTLLTGSQAEKEKASATIGQPKNFGYLGTVAPIGFGEQGQDISTGQQVKQGLGTGAEIASYLTPGVAPGIIKSASTTGKLLRPIGKGALAGATGGALGQAGAEAARDTSTASSISTQGAIGAGVGAAGGAILGTATGVLLGTKRLLSPNTEDALIQAIKPGKNNTAFRTDLRSAVPEIIRATDAPIENIDQFVQATNAAKKKVWVQYETLLGQNADATINGNIIADAIESSIDRRFETINRAGADRIRKIAKTYRRSITLEEAEDFLQSANNDLHSYYAKNKVGRRAAARDPEIAPVLKEAEAIRDQLYAKLQNLSGQNAAGIKKLYGALTNIEEEAIGRANVAARQAPFSLAEQLSFASALGDAAKSVLNLNAGDAAAGLAKFTGARMLKKANTSDQLIKTGIKKATKGIIKSRPK